MSAAFQWLINPYYMNPNFVEQDDGTMKFSSNNNEGGGNNESCNGNSAKNNGKACDN